MSQFSDPKTRFKARAIMWIDQIISNLHSIEKEFDEGNYNYVRAELAQQYNLITVLRNAKSGRTILQGWKTKLDNTGE